MFTKDFIFFFPIFRRPVQFFFKMEGGGVGSQFFSHLFKKKITPIIFFSTASYVVYLIYVKSVIRI